MQNNFSPKLLGSKHFGWEILWMQEINFTKNCAQDCGSQKNLNTKKIWIQNNFNYKQDEVAVRSKPVKVRSV